MKVLKNIFLIILILILFISSLSLMILVPVKYLVNPNTINNAITNLDIEKLVKNNPELEKTITDTLDPIISETEKYGIDEDIIIEIVNSKEIKGLVGSITGDLVDYALTGKKYELISIDKIKSIVNEAIDVINESDYYEISNADKENILEAITKESDSIEEIIPDTDLIEESLTNDYKDMLNIIRFIFGSKLVIYLSLTFLISLIGIIILKWHELKWIKSSAITIMLSSIVVLISFGIIRLGSQLLKEDNMYIYEIVKNVTKYNFNLALIIFVIMVTILIIYGICHKKIKQNKKLEEIVQ